MKPYSWEEIKGLLIKELKKTKHILTWGTIGSCNIEHDIDTIITKKPSSKTSDFYKEIHKLFDNLDKYLNKKYKAKSIRFSSMLEESVLVFLGSYKKKDIGFHTMIYTSLPQIKIDWAGAQGVESKAVNFKKILVDNCDYFLGSSKDIFSEQFKQKNFYDATYNFLQYADKTNSYYPKKLFFDYMNKMFEYIPKKRLGIEPFKIRNEKEIREGFYKLCDIIDKLNKEKK